MPPFRFAVNLLDVTSADAWSTAARQAEELGYDVVLVPDHLGLPAPFPALVAAAAATSLRVGTFVLNAGFYQPALLAREVATTDRQAAIAAEAHRLPYLREAEILDVPTLLVGTVDEIAEKVRRLRDQHAISYITVLQPYLEAFAPVIAQLRKDGRLSASAAPSGCRSRIHGTGASPTNGLCPGRGG